jgi:probable phosphoglycerate mutase
MKTLILVRHGESKCNLEGVIGGRLGCSGLSETGGLQVKNTAHYLSKKYAPDKVQLYSSDLLRAVETAEIISEAFGGINLIKKENLAELDPGEADSLTWTQYFEKYGAIDFNTEPDREVAPGGESWVGFLDRATDALNETINESVKDVIIIASHGGVIQASIIRWMKLPFNGTKAGLKPEYGSITSWAIEQNMKRLLNYNFVI